MPLLTIKQPYYSWLYQLEICRTPPTPNNTTLPLQESNLWQVGKLFGFLLMTISQQLKISTQSIESLLKLKQNNTVPVRLFNWNILIKIFSEIGIQITTQTKKQMIDGNSTQLHALIQNIYGLVVKQFVPANDTIDASLVHLQSQQTQELDEQNDYNSITQYFIVVLSKHMQLSKQNTINLLHDNNRLLNHLLVAGTSEIQQITGYLDQVLDNVQNVTYLFRDTENINIYCNMFKEGVISNSVAIFHKCIDIYRKSFQCCRSIKDWFKNYEAKYFIKVAMDYPQRAQIIINLLGQIYGKDLYQILKPQQISKLTLNIHQLFTFQLFIENLNEQDLNKYLSSPKLADWMSILISNTKSLKNSYITILIFKTLWERVPTFFTSHPKQLPLLYSAFLKQIIMKNQCINSNTAISTIFQLMTKLGVERNVYAPHLYKTICSTFQLLEIGDKMNYMIECLINSWKILPTLPVYLISSTLIRVLEHSPTVQLMNFVASLLNQGKFEENDEIEILNILFKGYLSNIHYSSAILNLIHPLIDYFEPERIQDTVLEISKLCLSIFFNINKNNPLFITSFQQHKQKLKQLEDIKDCNSIIRTYTLLKLFITKFTQYQQPLSKLICQTLISLKKHTKKQSQLLMRLLKLLHKQTSIYELLEQDIYEDKQSANDSKQSKQNSQKQQDFAQQNQKQSQLKEDNSSQQLQRYIPDESEYSNYQKKKGSVVYTESILPIDQDQQYFQHQYHQSNQRLSDLNIFPTTPNILPSQYRITKKHSESRSVKPSPTALQSIQDAKNKRLVRILTEIDRQKTFRNAEEQKIKKARKMIEKRSLQFGISKDQDVNVECVFDWNSLKQHTVQQLGLTDIKLIDWVYEQDQHIEALQAILKKYRKLWRFLFLKFSTFGGQKGSKIDKDQKMTIAEVWKFLHYYNLPLLKRQQMSTLVRLINESKGNRSQLQVLSYPNFQQFLVQYSCYTYKLNNVVCPSPAHSLLKLAEDMKTVAFIKKDNISIFQNPQNMYFKEEEVIQQFNKKLIDNPEYILPEGYKKIKQTKVSFFNELTSTNKQLLSQSFVISLQILSSIIQQHFQSSFVQPLIEKQQIVRAKPVLFQNLSQKLKQHKGYMQPRQVSPSKNQIPRIKHVDKTQFKPLVKFSLGIKLGISNVSMKNKFIAEEVAYLMDDMLNAVQNQSSKVTNLHKVSIVNQKMRDNQSKREEQKRVQEEKNQKRNKRIQHLRMNLSKQRDIMKQFKQQKQRLKTIQAEQQKIKHMSEEKRYQSIREKVKKKKMNDEQNFKMQRETEDRLKKIREKDRFKSIKQFINKQKQSLKNFQSQVKRKKQEEDLKIKQEQQKHSSQKQARLYLNILKNDEHLLGKVVTVKNLYTECWTSEQINQVNSKYEPELRLLFDLLLKHQNSKISTEYFDKISHNTFNHFCLKFKIVPTIVNHNNVMCIFKSLLKQNDQVERINFRMFQQALFRICVRAKQYLNSDMNATIKNRQTNQLLSRKRKNTGVVDEYLFDTTEVTKNTFQNLYQYLQMEKDKLKMEIRYRKAVESNL